MKQNPCISVSPFFARDKNMVDFINNVKTFDIVLVLSSPSCVFFTICPVSFLFLFILEN